MVVNINICGARISDDAAIKAKAISNRFAVSNRKLSKQPPEKLKRRCNTSRVGFHSIVPVGRCFAKEAVKIVCFAFELFRREFYDNDCYQIPALRKMLSVY